MTIETSQFLPPGEFFLKQLLVWLYPQVRTNEKFIKSVSPQEIGCITNTIKMLIPVWFPGNMFSPSFVV